MIITIFLGKHLLTHLTVSVGSSEWVDVDGFKMLILTAKRCSS